MALDFRHAISNLVNPIMSTPDDLPVQRFYLRKIEGADVLLTDETNFLRQELHKWAPIAPDPPKLIEASHSTRKPRPTKQQKIMASLGITNPEELPEHLRPKPVAAKYRKAGSVNNRSGSIGGSIQQSHSEQGDPIQSHTPPGLPHSVSSMSENRHLSEALAGPPPPFSYDVLRSPNTGTPAFRPSSPMFSAANNPFTSAETITAGNRFGPVSPGATAGIDPQLENMFGNPTGSPQAHEPVRASTDTPQNPSQDAMDLFGTLTHGENDDNEFTFAAPAPEFENPSEGY